MPDLAGVQGAVKQFNETTLPKLAVLLNQIVDRLEVLVDRLDHMKLVVVMETEAEREIRKCSTPSSQTSLGSAS